MAIIDKTERLSKQDDLLNKFKLLHKQGASQEYNLVKVNFLIFIFNFTWGPPGSLAAILV